MVGDTYIVSAGPYCGNLGSITLSWTEGGEKSLEDYHLTPIDESLPEDQEAAAMVERWKGLVGGAYLGRYGLSYDTVLTRTDFDLPTPVSGVQSGNALGELVADSFLWAVDNLEKDPPDVPTVTVTADGVLRAPLAIGEITTSMAFDVLSMGVGRRHLRFSSGGGVPHRQGAEGRRRGGRFGDAPDARRPALYGGAGVQLQHPPNVLQPGD